QRPGDRLLGQFRVPRTVGILVLNKSGITRNMLFGSRSLRRGQGGGPAWERLGKDITKLISPATIMGDDPVVNFCHAPRLAGTVRPEPRNARDRAFCKSQSPDCARVAIMTASSCLSA